MNQVKRNLGAGINILDGYINYDKFPINNKVKDLDIDKLPLKFNDDSAIETKTEHTLEHLNSNLYDVTKELIRTTTVGGKIIITLPSDCNVVTHTKDRFEPKYFNPFLKKIRNHPNNVYTSVTVSHIEVKIKYRTFIEYIKLLIHKLKLLRIKEITWIMTK